MLSCREVTRRASDYVDRELPLRERLAMRFHLSMCVRCRRLVRHLRYLVAALTRYAEKPEQPADPACVERILARLPVASSGDKDSGVTPSR